MLRSGDMACLMYRFVLLLISLLLFSACLTSRNTKAIDEYRSPINEFDLTLPEKGNYRVDSGSLSVMDGIAVMQFEKILRGSGRYLNVESSAQGMRFYESREKLPAGKRVYLVRQITCCMDDRAFREILFLKEGQQIAPHEILKTHFQLPAEARDYPAAILVMDFSNIYTFTAMHALWQNDSGVSYFVQAPGNDYNLVMEDISWNARSRLKLAGMYSLYALTVPVDIVTVPFQIAGLLMMGKGVVR
ncbi:MAG: hypothetical protein U1F27_09270 [Turneriella sp.]